MKSKVLLAVVVCTLLALIALPVLAQDSEPSIYVSNIRMAYNGQSSTGPDRVSAIVYVRDAARHRVAGATVEVTWTVQAVDGTVYTVTDSALTTRYGYAKFELWEGKGDYTIMVTNLAKDGYLWDYESSDTIGFIIAD